MSEEKFEYEFSAPTPKEKKEIESIARVYHPKEEKEKKIRRIRELDNKTRRNPTVFFSVIFVIGILVFGLGLTFVLEWDKMIAGIIIGVAGIVIFSAAFPLRNAVIRKRKAKYREEILTLSDEILHE